MKLSNTNYNIKNASIKNTEVTSNKEIKKTSESSITHEGHIIKGEITDISNNKITLQLENGETITARMEGNPEFTIGEKASFEVIEKSQSEIILKLVKDENTLSSDLTIQKALEAASLPKNSKNIAIVNELLKNNLSIDKQSILNILKQSFQFKNADISTIVSMIKNKLPLNNETISQYEAYKNYEHRILEQTSSFAESLSSLLDNTANFKSSEHILNFNNELVKILSDVKSPDISINDVLKLPVNLSTDSLNEILPILKELSVDSQLISKLAKNELSLGNTKELFENLSLQNNTNESPPSIELLSQLKNSSAYSEVNNKLNLIHQKYDTLGSTLTPHEISNLLGNLKELPLSAEVLQQIKSGDMPIPDMLKYLNELLPELDNDLLKTLISSKEYKSIIEHEFIKNWTLTPDELKENNSVKELYNRIYDNIEKINTSIEKMPSSAFTENAIRHSSSLKNNMDFMNLVNQMFNYVQLPIHIKDTNIHSDLYVYTAKKNLKEKKGSISVLLHLDLEHSGPIDIHIELENQKIKSKFYIGNDSVYSLFRANMKLLEERLLEKGYLLNHELLHSNKPTNLVDDFLANNDDSILMKRCSFDMRT